MQSNLMLTKIIVPPARSGLVDRYRVRDRIESGLAGGSRLLLVSAPAGSGKTTLVQEWIAGQERPVAWYALDEGDNDPVRFWNYFVAAVQKHIPDFGETALTSLQPSQPLPQQTFVAQLVNELVFYDQPLVIVLDDYHLIQNTAIHEALAYLLDHQPPSLVMMIVSRSDPPMPLARWRSRRQLTELRAVDLRFTIEESGELFNGVMGLAVTNDDLAALDRQTEGWAAGLQLAALALQSRLAQGTLQAEDVSAYVRQYSGRNRYILDYLVGEVLEQQPEETRTFLLQTCILERLCSDLCDYLLAETQSGLLGDESEAGSRTTYGQAMLVRIEKANLFLVPLDDQRSWFRYHKLFGDLLRHRAQTQLKDSLQNLHHRAAGWYERNGYAGDAIYHGLQAFEWELVARLVEQNMTAALARGETLTLLGWLDGMPEEVIHSRPWLCVAGAWGHLLTGQPSSAGNYLQAVDQAIGQQGEMRDSAAIQGHTCAIRAYLSVYQGELGNARALAAQALELLPDDELVVRSFVAFTLGGACLMVDELEEAQRAFLHASRMARAGDNIHIAAPSLRVIAQLLEARGELHRALTYCQEAIQLARTTSGRISPVAADSLGVLSDLHYEWNDLQAARQHANLGLELGERLGNADVLVSAYGRMANLSFVDGDFQAAGEWLLKAADLQRYARLTPGTGSAARALQVRLWVEAGDRIALRDWVDQHAKLEEPVSLLNERDLRSLANAWMSLGETDRALGLLVRHYQWAVERDLTGLRIKNLIQQAVTHHRNSAADTAMECLLGALALGEPAGYVRTYIDCGAELQVLLSKIRLPGTGISRDYLLTLLEAFGGSAEEGSDASGEKTSMLQLIEPLSERELEVLRLIAEGYSNQQVARELFISLGTVKAHTASIYRKLDVGSRTQAVAYARELELI
jgi:LuxR family maltose regulon positive regulatory protein